MQTILRIAALPLAALFFVMSAQADDKAPAPATFEDAMNASASNAIPELRLTPVREAALRETAMLLGMQWGIGDKSRSIVASFERKSAEMDRRYQFSSLIMGVGFMPAQISEARNSVSVEKRILRVAAGTYIIDAPAYPVIVAPTWRDWLYLGLQPDLRPAPPTAASVLPRDDAEKAYYKAQLLKGYQAGMQQTKDVFDLNLAQLERTIDGMHRFYDLYKKNMVTAPIIASATSIVDMEDPNQIVIGNTVFRIVQDTKFVTDNDSWKPLGK